MHDAPFAEAASLSFQYGGFVNKANCGLELQAASTDNSSELVEQTRRVERGSRIVCIELCGTKVVLQMPRGNLEVIHPRALVLSSVRHMLDQ